MTGRGHLLARTAAVVSWLDGGRQMSDAVPSSNRLTRGKVYLPLTAGESVGLPPAECGYRTPSHPQGLKGSSLKIAGPAVQRETMLVWFLHNFIPETGPVFGFAEAAEPPQALPGTLGSSPLSTMPLNGGVFGSSFGDAFGSVQVVGFDQGRWSSGLPALGLLTTEFGTLVDGAMLTTVSGVLPGLWIPKPNDLSPDAEQPLAELSSALLALLGRIDDLVRKLPLKVVGRGDNRSPEGLVELEGLPDDFLPVTAEVRDTVLRATADMRLALSSKDQLALAIAWQATLSAIKVIGAAVTSQVRMLYGDGSAATTLRTGAVGLAISLVGMELNLINQTGAAGVIVAAIGARMLGKKP